MLGWVTGLLGVEVASEILLNEWATTDQTRYLVAGICTYMILAVVFAFSMKTGELTTINTAWQCGNVVLVSLYGMFVLEEELTPRQKLGVAAAALSVYLVQ
tara:strand:+ start:1390 stop:1692 length:303 start_codon:yes stop_codon:yes gene_type:complete